MEAGKAVHGTFPDSEILSGVTQPMGLIECHELPTMRTNGPDSENRMLFPQLWHVVLGMDWSRIQFQRTLFLASHHPENVNSPPQVS